MTTKYKYLLFLLLAFMGITSVFAQSFTVQGPRQVVQGNKFNITFVLSNAEGSNFTAPEISGLTKIYGPAVSTSYNMQIVNGKSTSNSTEEYNMVYKATKAGKYQVGSASVMVNGKKLTTKPFTLEVLPPDKSANNASGQSGVQFDDPDTQQSSQNVSSKDIFVRISMSKQNVYEQEAVVCTIKLYTKYQISQFVPTMQPSFNGFLIEELPVSNSLNAVEHVNGENYMTAELKKCILYPQQSGKLTISSGNYDVTVVQYERYRSMFGYVQQPVEKQIKVKSNSATVNITPLPTPKPAGFNGAVGNYTMTTSISPQVLKTYDAATYKFVVKGTGNIKYIKNPVIQFPSQFEVYDPKNDINANAVGSNVSGSNTYEYTFIPQFVGKYSIPVVEFVYFDVAKRQYVTLKSQSFDLTVAKGNSAPQGNSISKGLEQKNTDILHIKQGGFSLQKKQSFYIDSFGYWLFYIVPVLIVAALLWYYRKQLKERSNVQLMKTKRANRVAQKRLKVAKKFMQQNDVNKFYAELLSACWGYLSDKLGIPVSELNKENIASELIGYGVSEELKQSVLELLDKCEFAQYAPDLANADLQSVLNETADIMDKLESTKHKK